MITQFVLSWTISNFIMVNYQSHGCQEKTTSEISLPQDTNFLRQFLMKSVARFSKKSVETEEEFQLVRDWVQWDFSGSAAGICKFHHGLIAIWSCGMEFVCPPDLKAKEHYSRKSQPCRRIFCHSAVSGSSCPSPFVHIVLRPTHITSSPPLPPKWKFETFRPISMREWVLLIWSRTDPTTTAEDEKDPFLVLHAFLFNSLSPLFSPFDWWSRTQAPIKHTLL